MDIKNWVLLLVLLLPGGCESTFAPVCFLEKCIDAEVRSTDTGRRLGLMNYDSLDEDSGMLFVFEKPGKYRFWMKNMKFAIDIIWVDANRDIVEIVRSAPPCEGDPCPGYGGSEEARYVIEVVAGFSDTYAVEVGDEVVFDPDL